MYGREGKERGGEEVIPMKRPSEHEVIVYRELIQPICEIALVDQPTGFVDYY